MSAFEGKKNDTKKSIKKEKKNDKEVAKELKQSADTSVEFEEQQINELEELDDWGSSWKKCKEMGLKWGGRGMGGRATGRTTVQTRDVVVEGCTMAYYGINLLDRTTLRLLQKRRYGLIGRNGVGKSTLMRRIASGTLPGFPPHIRVAQVRQELPSVDDENITPVDYVVQWNPLRRAVLKQIEKIENEDFLEKLDEDIEGIEEQANVLEQLYDLLEDEGQATANAVKILKDLGFNGKRREQSLKSMSGGWKMRASIALALAQDPDMLLLDEPTNHLDLEGVEWLKSYLLSPAAEDITVLITSHDSSFLDDVCTDIIRFFSQKLEYYPGNYSVYEMTRKEKQLGLQRTQESLDKQRKNLQNTIQKMQVQASRSDNAQGAVASRKKKLARQGAEKNEHGHRFRAQQDSYNGMSAIRMGSQNEIALGGKTGTARSLVEAAEKEWKMVLPNPVPLSLLSGCSCLQVKNVSLGFPLNRVEEGEKKSDIKNEDLKAEGTGLKKIVIKKKSALVAKTTKIQKEQELNMDDMKVVLENVTLDLDQKSKVAIVGKNGCGKSTLMRFIYEYDGDPNKLFENPKGSLLISGELSKHNNLKIAFYQQDQQDSLPYDLSPLDYLMSVAEETGAIPEKPSAGTNPTQHSEQTIRAHLGSFGLSGALALQKIGMLSGGQKARVVLAELTIQRPHLLLLDEPTNNLDLDSIRALKEALDKFEGACVIASHDMAFVEAAAIDGVYRIYQGKLTRLEGGAQEYKKFIQQSVSAQRKKI